MNQSAARPGVIELGVGRLRPLVPVDAPGLYAYLSDPAVTQLTSFPTVTPALVDGMIQKSIDRWAAGELGKWALVLPGDDRIVGTCGFNEWQPVHRWAEVAFDLAAAHWGQGLMRRAVAGLIGWAFQAARVDRLQAYVRVDNQRSERLLLRSGFQREGRLRGFRICQGQRHDFYLYGLLRTDERAGQTLA